MDGAILMRFAIAIVLVAASACTQVTSDYACTVDSECTLESGAVGRCEANQRCSYADAACSSGFRFGDLAGTSSNQCTGAGGSGSAGADACAVEVRAGLHGTCLRRVDGSVWCWGDGAQAATQVNVPAGAIAQVDVAGAGLCARYGSGSLNCSAGPKTGDLGISIRDLSIGTSHICAVTDGRVACLGSNSRGELGVGNTTPTIAPSTVIALGDARSISAGLESTCAVTTNNWLWCWGDNSRDELGQGISALDHTTTPVGVNLSSAASAVTVGDRFACGLTQSGFVSCWGDNTKGQTGQGSTGTTTNSPAQIQNLTSIVQVTAAGGHACARATDGKVWCWGANTEHESAAAAATAITQPTLVVDNNGAAITFLDVDAGALHTCGRTVPSGAVVCWGSNANGEIGDGTFATATYPTPSTVGCR
jgi:alpha-tubulin suppressor-like RCC1 family protein